jgi:hypothetical protein
LRIEAWPSGTDSQGLTRVELLRNGQPVLTNLFSPPVLSFKTNLPLADVESAWYCVRATVAIRNGSGRLVAHFTSNRKTARSHLLFHAGFG